MPNSSVIRPRSSPREVLQTLRRVGPVSRPELAQMLGVANSTISAHIDGLIEVGAVEDIGEGGSRGGRRPRLVQIRDGGGCVAAVELGSKHARLGLVNVRGELLYSEDYPIELDDGPEAVLGAVCERLLELARQEQVTSVLGVGLGVPGPVDRASGRIVGPARMPGWAGVKVSDLVAQRLKVPVVVDNDANLLTLGEYHARWPGGEVKHLVGVKVGRGIGCGIIASGQLHYGAIGSAGDISHVRLFGDREDAIPCGCGNKGCIETVASGAAVLGQLAQAGEPAESLAKVVERASAGDPLTNTLLRKGGSTVGEALAVVVNFFNPEVLLIGGVLSGADAFVSALRATVYDRTLRIANESLEVVVAQTGPDAGLLGAGSLILDRLGELCEV